MHARIYCYSTRGWWRHSLPHTCCYTNQNPTFSGCKIQRKGLSGEGGGGGGGGEREIAQREALILSSGRDGRQRSEEEEEEEMEQEEREYEENEIPFYASLCLRVHMKDAETIGTAGKTFYSFFPSFLNLVPHL